MRVDDDPNTYSPSEEINDDVHWGLSMESWNLLIGFRTRFFRVYDLMILSEELTKRSRLVDENDKFLIKEDGVIFVVV